MIRLNFIFLSRHNCAPYKRLVKLYYTQNLVVPANNLCIDFLQIDLPDRQCYTLGEVFFIKIHHLWCRYTLGSDIAVTFLGNRWLERVLHSQLIRFNAHVFNKRKTPFRHQYFINKL